MNPFLERDTYIVDQKVKLFGSKKTYKLLDSEGNQIGTIDQTRTPLEKILCMFIDKKKHPFTMELRDNDGNLIGTISRPITLFLANTSIKNASGKEVAQLKQKFTLRKAKLEITTPAGKKMATLKGTWGQWDFEIQDPAEKPIGSIESKLFNLKSMFTNADKYAVKLDASITDEDLRLAIITAAASLDVLYHE